MQTRELPLGIYTDIANNGSATLYYNGNSQGSGNNSGATTNNLGIAVGTDYESGVLNSNGKVDGDIAEVIIYNRALSQSERDVIGNYLATKYGLSFTP
jgi:hypothetical protein